MSIITSKENLARLKSTTCE